MMGILLASCESLFWLFACYFLWSWFVKANICGRNLALKLAPRSDNMA